MEIIAIIVNNYPNDFHFLHVYIQVMGSGSLVGAVVGTSVGLTLLNAVILLAWIIWNKR